MAYFPPFNGDSQPVFALDVNNGPQTGNIGSTDALVQPQGPKLDFFKVLVKDTGASAIDLRAQLGNYSGGGTVFNPGVVQQINQRVQQTATIAIYQVEGASTGQISYAIYPQDAYTAATLQTAIQNLGNIQITASDGTVTGVDVSGTVVTEPGFQLA
jgi:hypothetical protein